MYIGREHALASSVDPKSVCEYPHEPQYLVAKGKKRQQKKKERKIKM